MWAWFRTRRATFHELRRPPCAASRATPAETQTQSRATLAASADELSTYKDWWYGERTSCGDSGPPRPTSTKTPWCATTPLTMPKRPDGNRFVTDDVDGVGARLSAAGVGGWTPLDFETTVADDTYRTTQLSEVGTWGGWEWNHSIPPPDPGRYASTEAVLMTYSMSKAFTVSSPGAFEDFRTPTGLAAIRHYELNENAAGGPLGYFVSDVDPAGPFSMRVEALAMANGDGTSATSLAN